jgi:hypothetical protein
MDKKRKIYGLAFECPYQSRQADCLLAQIDHLPFKEKVAWINQQEPQKLEEILIAHKNCRNKIMWNLKKK